MLVHLNNVGDYKGYRFFQSSFMPKGNARQVNLRFIPGGDGQPLELKELMRNGTAVVGEIGSVSYMDFAADYMDESSTEYAHPAALIHVVTADGEKKQIIAFSQEALGSLAQIGKEEIEKGQLEVGGKKYQVVLDGFEKASTTHSLTIQYDPGRTPVYIGFALLTLALCGVFFFSHQRVWAVIEPDGEGSRAHFGGHTNRNRPAFEGRFNALVKSATGGGTEDE
jgi:cytochrome c biogenesis protein